MIGKVLKIAVCAISLGACCMVNASESGDKPYLKVWKSLEDVRMFSDYIEDQGVDHPSIDKQVVEKTISEGSTDNLTKICILTRALYSPASSVLDVGDAIRENLKKLVTEYDAPTFDGSNLNELMYYYVKSAYLLFLSQTENWDGQKLTKEFDIYPISIAKEYLEKQKNGLKSVSQKLLQKINTLLNN